VGDSKKVAIWVALIGAAATIAAAIITTNVGGGDHSRNSPTQSAPSVVISSPTVPPVDTTPTDGNASVFLSRDSGPGGSTVKVSGQGFAPGERVVLRFHTDQVGDTTADSAGKFANVAVSIPTSYSKFAPQQFSISADGQNSDIHGEAQFTITG
jgi:hypothetical protein